MTPREELDLILNLIKKYSLPLSPILEYAIKEKKDGYPEEGNNGSDSDKQKKNVAISSSVPESIFEEPATIKLTREIIEAARTPNGGFTKSQLAAVGVGWPPPADWIEKKTGAVITKTQLENFKSVKYISRPIKKTLSKNRGKENSSDVSTPQRTRNLSYKDQVKKSNYESKTERGSFINEKAEMVSNRKEDDIRKKINVVLRVMFKLRYFVSIEEIASKLKEEASEVVLSEAEIKRILRISPGIEHIEWCDRYSIMDR